MKWLNVRNFILTLLILAIGALLFWLKPYAEVEIKKLIAKEVLKYEVVKDFDLSNVKIDFLPPKIEFDNVDFLIKSSPEIKKIFVQKIKIYPELLRLLSFDLRLKSIYVSGLDLQIKDGQEKTKTPDFKFNYADLENIPIKNLYVEDSKVTYNDIDVEIGYFDLRKKWSSYELYSDLNRVRINEEVPEIKVNRISLEIREESIQLKKISLASEDSYLQLGLEINTPFNEKLLDLNFLNSTDIRLTSRLNLANFKPLIEKYLDLKVKKLSGLMQILLYKSATTKKAELEFTVEGEDITYDNYFTEHVSTNGKLSQQRLQANLFRIKNKNLVLESKNLILIKKKNLLTASSTGKVTKLELGAMLYENIGLSGIPLNAPAEIAYNCSGSVTPKIEVACELDGLIKSLHIWTDSAKKGTSTLIKLPESTFKANTTLFEKNMVFNSFHEFKNSQVAFDGTVDYIKGFNVNYASDFFNFSDIISLADIPLEGFGNIRGTTKGNANWGVFDLKSDISNLAFFEYNLGQVVGDISYKDQNLYFKNLRSVIGDSLINAEIDFDLKTTTIKASANSKKATITDLLYAVKEIAEPPVYLSGEGAIELTAEGPLDLGRLTYDIKADFKEGLIHRDRYKNLKIDIESIEGEVVTQNSLLYLGDTVNIEGVVNPKGMVDIIAMADSINLSRSVAIKELGVELTGIAQVQFLFTDFILLPNVSGEFKSASITDDYKNLGSSEFDFIIHKTHSEINGSLFNNSMVGEMHVPHGMNMPFLMNMELFKFDPFKFMTIFDSKISKVGSNTEISGNVNLQAEKFNVDNINGDLLLTEILFRAERSALRLTSPAELHVTNGILSGEINFVDHNSNSLDFSLSEDKNSVVGKISLGFLRTLLPSVDEIQGDLEINSEFRVLPEFKFVSGQGYIRDLSLKVEDLVHSFKDINSDLSFAKNSIYIKNMSGTFANGPINGDGRVYFDKGIGVELKGRADRLNLNIPEGFKSVASGAYEFSGVGFPYLLSGDFVISEGLFEMEFESGESELYTMEPSPYLPKSKLAVSPVDLDLNIKTAKPILINNSYIEGSAKADLNIKGAPSTPIMKGQIRLTNDSKLIFQSNKFNINSGLITFNSVPPESATLNIDANARIKDFVDILEREYDIRMLIQGTGTKPQISFSSQPTLSEPQILSFLAFGMLEDNSLNQEISLGSQQAGTGYQIGGIFLKNKFAKDIQERLGLQFNFTSSYENQDVSPKVIVEKKFNSKFSLSGSRTLGAFQKNTVRGEYKINKKLSIIGLYENWDLDNQATLNRARLIDGDNVLGMDLQYNIEFK